MNLQINSLLQDAIENFKRYNYSEAKIFLLKILDIEPHNFDALNMIGVVNGKENNHIEAISFFKKAQKIKPNNSFINFNLAKALSKVENDLEAIKYYKIAIRLDKNHFLLWVNLANSLYRLEKYDEALIHYDQAIKLKPDYAEAYNNKGLTLNDLKRYDEALYFYDQTIKLKPDYVHVYNNKGNTLNNLKRHDEALIHYDQAIKLKPDYAEAYNNKGLSLNDLKRHDEALIHYNKAIKLKPDYADAYNNKGLTLNNLNLFDEALIHYDQAIKLKPNYVDAYNNKGNTLNNLKRHDEALVCYDQAIKLKPNCVDPYYNKALVKLRLGDYQEGWNLYEYRWKKDFTGYRYYNFKLLDNLVHLKNKKILVWYEQGLGDTIMFSRYVNLLIETGAIVIFKVQKNLETFLRSQFKCKIVSKTSSTEFFDFQVPLLNLPKLFNTTLDNIPFNRSYLKVDYKKKKEWERKLQLSKNKLNIGLAISGNPNHRWNHTRSIPLENMHSLFQQANFFILQKELNTEDMKFLNNHKKINFLGKEINNFYDIAAIVENMDLIISVDTSFIHIAGALGKKSFLMLNYFADWRWLLERNTSPWYNSIKIFRQKLIGDWNFVINKIQVEFNNL